MDVKTPLAIPVVVIAVILWAYLLRQMLHRGQGARIYPVLAISLLYSFLVTMLAITCHVLVLFHLELLQEWPFPFSRFSFAVVFSMVFVLLSLVVGIYKDYQLRLLQRK
jgi:hypothetical protein